MKYAKRRAQRLLDKAPKDNVLSTSSMRWVIEVCCFLLLRIIMEEGA